MDVNMIVKRRKRVNALYTNLNAFLMTWGTGYRCPWCHEGMLERKGGMYHCPVCDKEGDVVSMAAHAWEIDEEEALEDLERDIPLDAHYEEEESVEPEKKHIPETMAKHIVICDDNWQEEIWKSDGVDAFSLEGYELDSIYGILPMCKDGGHVGVRLYNEAVQRVLIQKLHGLGIPFDVATPGQLDIDYYMHDIYTDKYKPIPTGLSMLDNLLEGGLMPQTLITLGGAPGTGKTSFATAFLENMAANGHDVIYINLEMSKEQLIARTLSRIVYQMTNTGKDMPVSISQKEALRGYSQDKSQREAMRKAATFYREMIAPRFTINPSGVDGPGQDGILKTIEKAANNQMALEGNKAPIVCIDYLQIVDFYNKDRKSYDAVEGMKKFINDLKRFAVKYNTVVILIIAHNRTSNSKGAVTMESGRDSSAIEYSGDVMLGLSYTAVEEGQCSLDAIRMAIDGGEILEPVGVEKESKEYKEYKKRTAELEKAKERYKEVTLKLLKGRMGESGRVKMMFEGRASMFVESGKDASTWDYTHGWKAPKETPFDKH